MLCFFNDAGVPHISRKNQMCAHDISRVKNYSDSQFDSLRILGLSAEEEPRRRRVQRRLRAVLAGRGTVGWRGG